MNERIGDKLEAQVCQNLKRRGGEVVSEWFFSENKNRGYAGRKGSKMWGVVCDREKRVR